VAVISSVDGRVRLAQCREPPAVAELVAQGMASAVVAVHCWTGSGPVTGRALIPGVRSKVLPAPVVVIGTQPNFRSPAMIRASVASESLFVRSPILGHGSDQSMTLAAGSVEGDGAIKFLSLTSQ
jgi:hypothetical protein